MQAQPSFITITQPCPAPCQQLTSPAGAFAVLVLLLAHQALAGALALRGAGAHGAPPGRVVPEACITRRVQGSSATLVSACTQARQVVDMSKPEMPACSWDLQPISPASCHLPNQLMPLTPVGPPVHGVPLLVVLLPLLQGVNMGGTGQRLMRVPPGSTAAGLHAADLPASGRPEQCPPALTHPPGCSLQVPSTWSWCSPSRPFPPRRCC